MRTVGALCPLAPYPIVPIYGTTACHCTADDAYWPYQNDCDILAQQVSQTLIHPIPLAQPCYANANTLASDCKVIVTNWTDGNWRADSPRAIQETNHETFSFPNGTIDACYLNVAPGIPCHKGSVPAVDVDACAVRDV